MEHTDGHEGIGRLLEDPLHLPEDEPAAGSAGRKTVREPGQIYHQVAEDHGAAGERGSTGLQGERGLEGEPGERGDGSRGVHGSRCEVRCGGYRGSMVPGRTGRGSEDGGEPQQVV